MCSRDTWCRYVDRRVDYWEHAAYSRVFTLARAGGGRRHGRVQGQRTDCPCAAARVHAHAHSTDRRVFTLSDAPTARPQRGSGSCSVGWRQREAGRNCFPPFPMHTPVFACMFPCRHVHGNSVQSPQGTPMHRRARIPQPGGLSMIIYTRHSRFIHGRALRFRHVHKI